MHTVFVYGSLMRGFGNHGLLTESTTTFLRRATVEGFALHSLGSFPAAVPYDGNGSVIHGEVYSVTDATLARLDRLEGHPTFYERQQIDTADDLTPIWMYVFQGNVNAHCVSGDWRDYHDTNRKAYSV